MTRRKFIISTTLLLGGAIVWNFSRDKRGDLFPVKPSFMPHESQIHQRTWLSYSRNPTGLDSSKKHQLKQNIIFVAATIAQYEPVSIIVGDEEKKELIRLLGNLEAYHYPIEIVTLALNEIYLRDVGPTFVFNEADEKAAVNFHVNRHNEREALHFQTKNIDTITSKVAAKIVHSNLHLKGGCFETDGFGTAIMTEPCIINDIQNPYWDKLEIESELKLLLGLKKIIWLQSIGNEEIIHTQTDYYVRFVREGVVLVHRNTNETSHEYLQCQANIKILQNARDAQNNSLQLIMVDAPQKLHSLSDSNYLLAGYLGYYLCNHALIMQTFGDDEADYNARQTLQGAFPKRTIEEVQIDALSSVGGYLHRVTLQEPHDNKVQL